MIILDNITTPYYRKFGCKWFGHKKFWYDYEDNLYICYKCFKHFTSDEYKKFERKTKLNNVI